MAFETASPLKIKTWRKAGSLFFLPKLISKKITAKKIRKEHKDSILISLSYKVNTIAVQTAERKAINIHLADGYLKISRHILKIQNYPKPQNRICIGITMVKKK